MSGSREVTVKVSLWGVANVLCRSLLLILTGLGLGVLGTKSCGEEVMFKVASFGLVVMGMLTIFTGDADKRACGDENP